MRFSALLLFPLLLCALGFPISVISPVNHEIYEGSTIYLQSVGPGQTFVIAADPKVSTGGKYGLGGAYDMLFASSLPYGWSSNPSNLYSNPLQADITVPKDAPEGDYAVRMTLWDESGNEGLGENISFNVRVSVTDDVMEMHVDPSSLSIGAGQPARYSITVLNKGKANDIYTISSNGVRDWEFRRTVYIPSETSKTIVYEVVGNDEADYKVRIIAASASSERIHSEQEVALHVNTDLFSDYRAVNRGVLLFPLPEAPVYFIVGLLSNLLPA